MALLLPIAFLAFFSIIAYKENRLLVLWIVLFVILMGLNTDNPDYINYLVAYGTRSVLVLDFQYLWALISYLGNVLGLSYQQFLLCSCILGYLVFARGLIVLEGRIGFSLPIFCLLYGFYPFFLDVVQIRNFLAMSFFFLAFTYLLSEKQLNKALICLLCAAGFHSAAWFYLPVLFLPSIIRRGWLREALAAGIVISIGLSFAPAVVQNAVNSLLSLVEFDAARAGYISAMRTDGGRILSWLIILFNIFICYRSLKMAEVSPFKTKHSDEDWSTRFIRLAFWVNVASLLYWNLFFYNIEFIRLIRNLIPINLALVLHMSARMKAEKKSGFGLTVLFVVVHSATAVFFLYEPLFQDVVSNVLTKNILLG